MNASMNDSHNLGVSSFPVVTIELNCFLSLENRPSCSWVGRHAPFINGKQALVQPFDYLFTPRRQYESERRKFALDLIAFDKMWSTLFCGKPLTEEHNDGVSPQHFIK
jgi:hypothetical protein